MLICLLFQKCLPLITCLFFHIYYRISVFLIPIILVFLLKSHHNFRIIWGQLISVWNLFILPKDTSFHFIMHFIVFFSRISEFYSNTYCIFVLKYILSIHLFLAIINGVFHYKCNWLLVCRKTVLYIIIFIQPSSSIPLKYICPSISVEDWF